MPGGFNPHFDLLEINADVSSYNEKVVHALWDFWNAGHRYYLSGGTDVHDVWNQESGRVRTFAHLDGEPTAQSFAAAVKGGRAYVTYGPLIMPSVMFGSVLKLKPDEHFVLAFKLQSVSGLKQATLIGAGSVVATQTFAGAPRESALEFPVTAGQASWYSLEVEDQSGRKAYTNPIWIDCVTYPPISKPR